MKPTLIIVIDERPLLCKLDSPESYFNSVLGGGCLSCRCSSNNHTS